MRSLFDLIRSAHFFSFMLITTVYGEYALGLIKQLYISCQRQASLASYPNLN